MSRWAWAEVDLGAITHNVEVLRAVAAPAAVWAVVKADGYGHGAVPVARRRAGRRRHRSVRRADAGGVALRDAGIDCPILVLSEQPPSELADAVRHGLELTVYSHAQLDALAAAGGRDHPVHLKIDTGMHRVGAAAADASALAAAIARVTGACGWPASSPTSPSPTSPTDPYTAAQLASFDDVLAALGRAGHRRAAGARRQLGGALAHPASRFDFVRAGIAMYGISPGAGVDHLAAALRPALSLRARVSLVKRVRAGDRISYGLRHRSPATRRSPPCRSATPTACRAGCSTRRRGADRRAAPADRRRRHDGPADGRLRRRPTSPSATRWC